MVPLSYPLLKNNTLALLENEKWEPGKIIVRFDGGGARHYTMYESVSQLEEYYLSVPAANRSHYEIFESYMHQKSRFDIDGEKSASSFSTEDFIDDFLQHVIAFFANELDVVLDPERDILIFDSSDKQKHSFHIIIDNYYHVNNIQAKELYRQLMSKVGKYDVNIDQSVYSSSQNFRLYLSSKNGKRIKRFKREWRFEGRVVRSAVDESELLSRSLISNVEYCQALPLLTVESRTRTLREFVGDVNPVQLMRVYCEDNGIPVDTFAIRDEGCNSTTLFRFDRLAPSFCPNCQRVHTADNPYIYITDDGSAYYNCSRDERAFTMILAPFADDLEAPPKLPVNVDDFYAKNSFFAAFIGDSLIESGAP